MKRDLSLYLHFPFCKQKCQYCDFNSYSGRDDLIPAYLEALVTEIERFLPQERRISSVYFGGGTPSYVPAESLVKILRFLKHHFQITSHTEITLEINPGTVSVEDLLQLKDGGFNRLSIGLQATQNILLKSLGRIHSREEFETIYALAREVGFSNIGVDLIFGLPGQTAADWELTLRDVIKLNPEHISAYGLQLEKGTPLFEKVEAGEVSLPDEDQTVTMMETAMKILPQNGFEHYEISNYAKSGFHSIHNLAYWHGQDYLGFGAGATSTNYGERRTNVKDPGEYTDLVKKGSPIEATREIINRQTAVIESVMLGLRMRTGIDVKKFHHQWGLNISAILEEPLSEMVSRELLRVDNGHIRLTDQGILISNYVIGRLMEVL